MPKFNPNSVTFAEGAVRVERAVKAAGAKLGKRVITSRDAAAKKLAGVLGIKNVPRGFKKWQLPFVMERSQLFITVAEPNAKAGRHSHSEGDGIRFIAEGSIIYRGQELTAGDWMYIPAGTPYDFKVGPNGATMCYCYECCCAGKLDLLDFLGDPVSQKRKRR